MGYNVARTVSENLEWVAKVHYYLLIKNTILMLVCNTAKELKPHVSNLQWKVIIEKFSNQKLLHEGLCRSFEIGGNEIFRKIKKYN